MPERVAKELQRGGDVELGEIEVTLFFVDIRGYTPLSATRSAAEVFAITSEYTTAVSRVIDGHGGVVVEFQGDGLMAVFGAPTALPEKEAAATKAAREVFDLVGATRFGDVEAGTLSVGVGIATGPAFVGNIQSVGQKVWSVMGNTTNLAARLESLTRDLDAAIVIDTTTYERVAGAAIDFERHDGIPIKGRSEPFTVFAKPLEHAGSPA